MAENTTLGIDVPSFADPSIALKRSSWEMFPWLYNGYTQLLARVHRFGAVDAKGHAIGPLRLSDGNQQIIEYFQSTNFKTTDESQNWCAAFINWCFSRAGIVGTRTPRARDWLEWRDGKRLSVLQPVIGSIAVFPRGHNRYEGHVAMVWNVYHSDGSIDVLGGNQGARGAHPNQNLPAQSSRVSIAHHKLTSDNLLGFVWPKDYPLPYEPAAKALIHTASAAVPPDLRPQRWDI